MLCVKVHENMTGKTNWWLNSSLQIMNVSLFSAALPIHTDLFLQGGYLWTLSL